MNDKDLILKTMLPKNGLDVAFTPLSLKEKLFPNLNVDEVEFLIKEIIREKPELIKIEKVIGFPFTVVATGLIEPFLKKGGFTKIEKDLENEQIKKTEREKIEFKLSESNIRANELNAKNSKFNRWATITNIFIGILNIGLLKIGRAH